MDSRLQSGYFLVDRREVPNREPYEHELCGPTTIVGAICPNCDKPLLTLARLDAEDPRLELGGTGLGVIPLLFCWTCEVSQEPFSYELIEQGKAIHLLQWRNGSRSIPPEDRCGHQEDPVDPWVRVEALASS